MRTIFLILTLGVVTSACSYGQHSLHAIKRDHSPTVVNAQRQKPLDGFAVSVNRIDIDMSNSVMPD